MAQQDDLELCQTYLDRGAAEVICARLASDGVPAHIEAGAFDAPTRGYNVMVPRALAHKARWILAQLPPSEEDLEYLATGKLPGQDSSE